jgi:SAM-dependent methyltransferase
MWRRRSNRDDSSAGVQLPFPPREYREWVGPLEDERYDNPDGALVYPDFAPERYESVFDFGCGCGRVARQLILQRPRPGRYVGIDVHPAMIAWCQANLAPAADGFEFRHHDVADVLVNAGADKPAVRPFPVSDASVTLFEGLSIFTHIVESQLAFYLREAARVLREDGEMNASFLLFEKVDFPALGPARNALYIDEHYHPSGVYYDRQWLESTLTAAGLQATRIAQRPEVHGYQWRLVLARVRDDFEGIALPRDEEQRGTPRDLAARSEQVNAD